MTFFYQTGAGFGVQTYLLVVCASFCFLPFGFTTLCLLRFAVVGIGTYRTYGITMFLSSSRLKDLMNEKLKRIWNLSTRFRFRLDQSSLPPVVKWWLVMMMMMMMMMMICLLSLYSCHHYYKGLGVPSTGRANPKLRMRSPNPTTAPQEGHWKPIVLGWTTLSSAVFRPGGASKCKCCETFGITLVLGKAKLDNYI